MPITYLAASFGVFFRGGCASAGGFFDLERTAFLELFFFAFVPVGNRTKITAYS